MGSVENGGKSFSVPPMSPVLSIQVERRIEILQKDCDKAAKEGECTLVYQLHVVSLVGATQADADGVLSTH